MRFRSGRHFLQLPGPTNVPDRVLRAIDAPTIDHRGPEFRALTFEVLEGLKAVFQTGGPVVIYPASGTGAWEAAMVNTLSPGDRVLMTETGHFSSLWQRLAERLGLSVELIPGDVRDASSVRAALRDRDAVFRREADQAPECSGRSLADAPTGYRDRDEHRHEHGRDEGQEAQKRRVHTDRACRHQVQGDVRADDQDPAHELNRQSLAGE